METVIPCSDDFRHPDGTTVTFRLLPALFFGRDGCRAYPPSSPLRCHHCARRFSTPPLFLPTRCEPQGGSPQVTGHYCSSGCRNLDLELLDAVHAETYRMIMVLVDRAAFGRLLDYTAGRPGEQPLAVADAERASGLLWTYRLRGVRETWFGPAEGGRGRTAVLRALAEEWKAHERSGISARSCPEAFPQALFDARRFEALLDGLPGSPRFVVRHGRPAAPTSPTDKHAASSSFMETWPVADGSAALECDWCARTIPAGTPYFLLPSHRDLVGTVTLQGQCCTPGCGLSRIMHDDARGIPSRRSERIGLYAWICNAVLGVPLRARPRLAPHRLELQSFGGDLTEEQFLALEACEDFASSLEHPPAVSYRMTGNYLRPGVVCDLTRLGNGGVGSSEARGGGESTARAQGPQRRNLFEELLRES